MILDFILFLIGCLAVGALGPTIIKCGGTFAESLICVSIVWIHLYWLYRIATNEHHQ